MSERPQRSIVHALEESLIDQQLCAMGHDPKALRKLAETDEAAKAILSSACIYASGQLATAESRHRFRSSMRSVKN